MKTTFSTGSMFSGVTTALLLVCTSNVAAAQVRGGEHAAFIKPGSARPAAASGRPIVFVSSGSDYLYILNFQPNVSVEKPLSGFSQSEGLAVGQSGDLYVADGGNEQVVEYAPPYNNPPSFIYNDANYVPYGVGVDAAGDVCAANVDVAYDKGPGSIVFFAADSTNPISTITSSDFQNFYSCAFDSSGNAYVLGQNSNGTLVGEIVGGVLGTSITTLTTGNTLAHPYTIAVTKAGLIAILTGNPNFQYAGTINVYEPPVGGSLGNPVSTAVLANAKAPAAFALAPDDSIAIVADFAGDNVQAYRFPGGGQSVERITIPWRYAPSGVAIYPSGEAPTFLR